MHSYVGMATEKTTMHLDGDISPGGEFYASEDT